MRRNIAVLTVLPVLLAAVAGCSYFEGKEPEVDPNLFPSNYRTEVLNTMTKLFSDPTNVRDAGITDPVLRPTGKDQRYAVCIRSNARDSDKKYMGVTHRIAWFYGGRLNQLIDATPEQCNDKTPYKPFPELEKLCLGKSCA